MILIDQVPLREAAERDARKGMMAMARLRAQLEEFEKKVLPDFQRWESATFGALLTQERELSAKVHEFQILLDQVAAEQMFSGCSQEQAYRRIMRERDASVRNPRGESESEWEEPEDEGLPVEERIFREFLRDALGVDPAFLRRKDYEKMFKDFRRASGMGENPKHHQSAARKGERFAFPEESDRPARVKELYRILARRLHPDAHVAGTTGTVLELWHDLQAAYARSDVERMEILLAMTDLHEGVGGARTTLFHMREVAREFLRGLSALKSQMNKARKTPAWEFWKKSDHSRLEKKMRGEIEERIYFLREDVVRFERLIAFWTPSARSRKTSRRDDFRDQSFFNF